MRDIPSLYNPCSIEQLEGSYPAVNWKVYFNEIGFNCDNVPYIINCTPAFLEYVNGAIERVDEWKTYLEWHLINGMAPYLSNDIVDEDFQMKKVLSGVKELEPRWKRVINSLNANTSVGEMLGYIYCERHFRLTRSC